MGAISILVVGETQREEFRHARATLAECGQVVDVADLAAATETIVQEQIAPDLIVVAQAYPGQFAPEAIDRLRRFAPLARLVGLMGSWCEGETRTGDPWPATIRVYWHQWGPRAARQLRALAEGLSSSWGLPVTAGDEERMLACPDQIPRRRNGTVVICSWLCEMAEWLIEVCRRAGYSAVWFRPDQPVHAEGITAAIFDGSEADEAEIRQLERLTANVGSARVLALLDFPRIEDERRARAAGAAAVLSKPLLLEDLFWELDRMVGKS